MEIESHIIQCSVDEPCSRNFTCTSNSYFTGTDKKSKVCCSGKSECFPVLNNESNIRIGQHGCAGSTIFHPYETEININSAPQQTHDLIENKQQQLFTQHARKQHGNRNESTSTRRAKFRSYSKYSIREQSFIGWTSDCVIPIWMFAKAGFFYKGFADIVACFECGIIHRRWQKDDDPVKKHILLQPECPYINDLMEEGIQSCEQLSRFGNDSCEENIEMRDVSKRRNNVAMSMCTSSSSQDTMTDTRLQCKICLTNPLQITIQPCGHFSMCESCYIHIRYENNRCPICRGPIKDTIRTFVP
ncbi:BIRC7_8 [Mytilus coruscus]|uniref:BIRC7_8 n=1 Tax=Mytilus coruscus TaxID=42192 RepID=A0A6J8CUU3_MYTCO|nr:BIRC7_8 [Mytilus coruscus]